MRATGRQVISIRVDARPRASGSVEFRDKLCSSCGEPVKLHLTREDPDATRFLCGEAVIHERPRGRP